MASVTLCNPMLRVLAVCCDASRAGQLRRWLIGLLGSHGKALLRTHTNGGVHRQAYLYPPKSDHLFSGLWTRRLASPVQNRGITSVTLISELPLYFLTFDRVRCSTAEASCTTPYLRLHKCPAKWHRASSARSSRVRELDFLSLGSDRRVCKHGPCIDE
jgi:hypothetical protein